MSKEMDELLKLAHKMIDVVGRANQNRIFAKKKDDWKFQQMDFVEYKLEEFIYLFDVMTSVYEKVITKKPSCNVLQKVITLF